MRDQHGVRLEHVAFTRVHATRSMLLFFEHLHAFRCFHLNAICSADAIDEKTRSSFSASRLVVRSLLLVLDGSVKRPIKHIAGGPRGHFGERKGQHVSHH